jgi:hypothetical protein
MVPVEDLRFDADDWPLSDEVPSVSADAWMDVLQAECNARNWHCAAQAQIAAAENSGTITVSAGVVAEAARLDIVWSRTPGGPLVLRARSSDPPVFSLSDAKGFLEQIKDRAAKAPNEQFYSRGYLYYEGLPWRGELWLAANVKLGPPTQDYQEALIGPRVIVVDAMVSGYGRVDAGWKFDHTLRELAAFLTVVLRRRVSKSVSSYRTAWTWDVDAEQRIRTQTVQLGYLEPPPATMPRRGESTALPLVNVSRPDFSIGGIDISANEMKAPSDTPALWEQLASSATNVRNQFVQVARVLQVAFSIWGENKTTSAALMVVACESLKPLNSISRKKREQVYFGDVVDGLLGADAAARLEAFRPHPQGVRDTHLHHARVSGAELAPIMMFSSYIDPSFDEMARALALITPAAAIEWLKLGGNYSFPSRPPKPKKDRAPNS